MQVRLQCQITFEMSESGLPDDDYHAFLLKATEQENN